MEIIAGYKAAKQNTALLKIFSEGFPGNIEVTQGLENRKRPVHDEQSINLLCAQEALERKREEIQNAAIILTSLYSWIQVVG